MMIIVCSVYFGKAENLQYKGPFFRENIGTTHAGSGIIRIFV
jgi:hypothetical protein